MRESLGLERGNQGTADAPIEGVLTSAMERDFACYALKQAIAKMERDWGHAIDAVNLIANRFNNTRLEKDFSQLLQFVEDFELERATKLSQEIQDELYTLDLPADDDD